MMVLLSVNSYDRGHARKKTYGKRLTGGNYVLLYTSERSSNLMDMGL